MSSGAVLTLESTVVRASHVLSADLADETVMADLDRGSYFGLNNTASWIWKQLVAPRRVAELCDSVVEAYRVEPETCRREVIDLLNELRDQRLIDVCQPG